MSESPSGKREGFQNNATRKVYYWLEPGLLPHVQHSGTGSESPEQRGLSKFIKYAQAVSSWLKQIGYMFAKQFYWYKLRGLLFKLRRPWAFQLSLCFLLGAYWLAGSRLPDGGGESHHFTGNRNPVPAACQPQPRQPHSFIFYRAYSMTWTCLSYMCLSLFISLVPHKSTAPIPN